MSDPATPWTAAWKAFLSFLSLGVCSDSCPLKLVTLSNHLILCHPFLLLPSIFPSIRVFSNKPVSQLFAAGSQSIGASASASVLPMNIQHWFALGLTGLISLQYQGLSRDFSSTTVQKHQFFGAQPSLWSNSHICIWPLEKPQLSLYRPLSAKWCLYFPIRCLGLYCFPFQGESVF